MFKPHNSNNYVIYYPININNIFGQSKMENENSNEIFDLTFKGIRFCELPLTDVNFYIKLNDIFNIIENKIDDNSNKHEELKKLEIIESSLLVNYLSSQTKIDNHEKNMIKQRIKLWTIDDQYEHHLSDGINRVKVKMDMCVSKTGIKTYKIKKLIFQCDQGHKLINCNLQIDGFDMFYSINPDEMNTIYEFDNNIKLNEKIYAIDLDTIELNCHACVVLCLGFTDFIDNLSITAFFEIETECLYFDGLLTF
jgi:hypothetical protein